MNNLKIGTRLGIGFAVTLLLMVATRKGAWLFHGDPQRRHLHQRTGGAASHRHRTGVARVDADRLAQGRALERTQTIMQGASHCDFRFRRK